MVSLKELLDGEKAITVYVEDEDYKLFLQCAKEEGFLWNDGRVINPYVNCPSNYTKGFVVSNGLFISQPHSFYGRYALMNKKVYNFKDLKGCETYSELYEKTARTQRIDNDYEEALELRKKQFDEKCKQNRIISQKQLKYRDITKRLQKTFFVRYQSEDELLRMFDLLNNYGYENYYNINIVDLSNSTNVLCVDNEKMIFTPANIYECIAAKVALKKINNCNSFEVMMKDIFKEG